MEQLLKIPAFDDKLIYGRLRGSLAHPLVIFVHGLGGRMDQHIYFNGSRFLEKNGISSFRFNLYMDAPKARNLSNCTLRVHSLDFDTVVSYFRKYGVKKIIAVGHSFGGPTILLSEHRDFDGVILWDPSYGYPKSFTDIRYVESLDKYIVSWEFDLLFSKEMVDEGKTLKNKEEAAIKEIKVPLKIINAENSFLTDEGKIYFELANKPKERVVIKDSGHTFDEDGVEEKLFGETLNWMQSKVLA